MNRRVLGPVVLVGLVLLIPGMLVFWQVLIDQNMTSVGVISAQPSQTEQDAHNRIDGLEERVSKLSSEMSGLESRVTQLDSNVKDLAHAVTPIPTPTPEPCNLPDTPEPVFGGLDCVVWHTTYQFLISEDFAQGVGDYLREPESLEAAYNLYYQRSIDAARNCGTDVVTLKKMLDVGIDAMKESGVEPIVEGAYYQHILIRMADIGFTDSARIEGGCVKAIMKIVQGEG